MINYGKVGRWSQIKYSIIHFYSKNKSKIFILGFLLIVFLLTGILTAFKISDVEQAIKKVEFSFEVIAEGDIYKFSYFIKRCLSVLIVVGILFVCSLNKYISILGYTLICYRMFLIFLNCTLIIRYMGLGGIINVIVIILPCQLIQICLLSLIFFLLCLMRRERKICGTNNKNYLRITIILLLISLIVNFIELLLLLLFKATTILLI